MKEDRNTVLIVEDQKINRTILRYMIRMTTMYWKRKMGRKHLRSWK